MRKKVFIKRILSFLILPTIILASLVFGLTNRSSAAEPAKFTDNSYKTIEYNGKQYYYMFDSYCDAQNSTSKFCDRPRTDNRKALYGDNQDNSAFRDHNSAYFVVNQNDWDSGFSCSALAEESPMKWIRVWLKDLNAIKSNPNSQIRGTLYSYDKQGLTCNFQPEYLEMIDVVGYVQSNPTSGTYIWAGQTNASLYQPSGLTINQTKPTQLSYVYDQALSNAAYFVYKTFTGSTVIGVSTLNFEKNLPTEGSIFSIVNNKVDFSKRIGDKISLINPNTVKGYDVGGGVYWGGTSPHSVKNFDGDPMEVQLYQDNKFISKVLLDKTSGTYTFKAVPIGKNYEARIEYKTSNAFVSWVESWGGIIDKTETNVSGKTPFVVNVDGVDPALVDIGIQTGTVTTPGLVNNVINDTLNDVTTIVLDWIGQMTSKVAGFVGDLMEKAGNISKVDALEAPWIQVRNLTLGLLTLGILIIAFANVLQIDLEKYGIDKMIPRLVIGVVMAYFSFLLARFLLEIATAFQSRLMENITQNGLFLGGIDFKNNAGVFGTLNDTAMKVFAILIGIAILLVLLYLAFVLIIRIVVLWILIVIAPLAFIMNVMPFTEFLWNMWWQRWWKWLFIGPAAAFFLWLGDVIVGAYPTKFDSSNPDTWIALLMAATCIALAAIIPMQIGGDVIGAVMKGMQKLPGLGHASEFFKQRGAAIEQRRQRSVAHMRASLGRFAPTRGFITGMNKRQQLEAKQGVITEERKSMVNMSDKALVRQAYLSTPFSIRQKAYMAELADRGKVDTDDRRLLGIAAHYARADRAINAALTSNQPEIYAAFANAGIPKGINANWTKEAIGGVQKVSNGDYHPEQMKFIFNSHNPALTDMVNKVLNDQNRLTRIFQVGNERTLATLGEYLRKSPGLTPPAALTQAWAELENAAVNHEIRNGKKIF